MRRAAALGLLALGLAACGTGSSQPASRPAHPTPAGLSPAPAADGTRSASLGSAGGGSSSPPARTPAPATPAVSGPPHVMIVVLENQEYGSVMGSPAAPYINGLAGRFGLATNYHARSHPSLPNYLDLISGSTHGIPSDCTACEAAGDTIADQLARRGIGWTAYMEGAPGPCFEGGFSDGYAKKHNPFAYFPQLREEAACRNVVRLSRMTGDLGAGRLTPFVWISPDLCHDGHDCGLHEADRWLSTTMPEVMASNWYRAGGAILVTWDEGTTSEGCCQSAAGGHVATLVVSQAIPGGSRLEAPVSHAGTLRTLERLYGLPLLGEAACDCSGDLRPLLGR